MRSSKTKLLTKRPSQKMNLRTILKTMTMTTTRPTKPKPTPPSLKRSLSVRKPRLRSKS